MIRINLRLVKLSVQPTGNGGRIRLHFPRGDFQSIYGVPPCLPNRQAMAHQRVHEPGTRVMPPPREVQFCSAPTLNLSVRFGACDRLLRLWDRFFRSCLLQEESLFNFRP